MPEGVDADEVSRIADAVNTSRDLVNTPTSDLGPDGIEAAARTLAEKHGASFTSIVGEDLLEQNFPMIHAVGRASAIAPRLIDFTWGSESAPRVTLVGKGVAFDTGGLDIKPPSSMLMMRKDMGGAAAALALADMIMGAKLPVRLRVLIPAVENSISSNAFRPGDILSSRKGISVEIGNTDAEGRLILADALTLADEENPELLVDFATLTGAARVALGPELPPFFTDDDALANEIATQGLAVERPSLAAAALVSVPVAARFEIRRHEQHGRPHGGVGHGSALSASVRVVREGLCPFRHLRLEQYQPGPARPEGGDVQAARLMYSLLKDRYRAVIPAWRRVSRARMR